MKKSFKNKYPLIIFILIVIGIIIFYFIYKNKHNLSLSSNNNNPNPNSNSNNNFPSTALVLKTNIIKYSDDDPRLYIDLSTLQKYSTAKIKTIDWGDNIKTYYDNIPPNNNYPYRHFYKNTGSYIIIVDIDNPLNINIDAESSPSTPEEADRVDQITDIIKFPDNCKYLSLIGLKNLTNLPKLPDNLEKLMSTDCNPLLLNNWNYETATANIPRLTISCPPIPPIQRPIISYT